jgi:hypothetical protein
VAGRAALTRSTRDTSEPIIERTCGATDHAPLAFAGMEPFLISSVGSLGVIIGFERVLTSPGRARELSRRPPTPPPRAA